MGTILEYLWLVAFAPSYWGMGLKDLVDRPSTDLWRFPFATALSHIVTKGLKLHCAFSYKSSYIN